MTRFLSNAPHAYVMSPWTAGPGPHATPWRCKRAEKRTRDAAGGGSPPSSSGGRRLVFPDTQSVKGIAFDPEIYVGTRGVI